MLSKQFLSLVLLLNLPDTHCRAKLKTKAISCLPFSDGFVQELYLRVFISVSIQNVSVSVVLWFIANTLRFCSVVGGFRHFLQRGAELPTALPFLGAFTKFRKATITLVLSVCLSVRMEQLGSN